MILGICESPNVLEIMNIVVTIIKVIITVVPIILLFSLIFKAVSAATQGKEDALVELKKKAVPNIVAAVLIFLIPTLVSLIVTVSFPESDYTKCISGISRESIQEIYEEKAERLVRTAEETLNISDYSVAMNYMPKVKDDDKREAYEKRLEEVKKLIDEARTPPTPIVIDDDDNEIFPADPYNISEDDLQYLANVCYCEQGSDSGVAAEASLMANLYELHKSKYDSVVSYVRKSGWFACRTTKKVAPATQKEIVRDVLNNGNRRMPPYINEHDCFDCSNGLCKNGNRGDICMIVTNGITYESLDDIKDRSNYIKNNTVIYNKYGSVYTFYSFPCERCDPFGYTASAYNKYNS